MQRRRIYAVVLVVVLAVAITGSLAVLLLAPTSHVGVPPPIGTAFCPSTPGTSGAGNWTTYHQSNGRSAFEPRANVSAVRAAWSSPTPLDGDVYAEPLVCGPTVYVATENDSVYAINASSGAVLWRTNVGTPVPGSALPCGDIDPSGITGTPVLDPRTGTLYAVAFVSPLEHELVGVNATNGRLVSRVAADPVGSDPSVEQQRGALALADGRVYVPYGGLDGDCGAYHGWVVGLPISGTGAVVSYQVPTNREGGIWSAAGITVAANGNLLVSTGNGDSTTNYDFGDSVIELSPALTVVDSFAPTDWAQLNGADTDLGSVAPTLLPNGDVFQVGKGGVGYLLSGTHLGGIGGQLYNASVCGGAYGGTATVGWSIYVPCTDGLVALLASPTGFNVTWTAGGLDAGSPIVTGNVVWVVDISTANLLGLNASTGVTDFSFPLGSVEHFISPAAAPESVFVAGGSNLYAFALT